MWGLPRWVFHRDLSDIFFPGQGPRYAAASTLKLKINHIFALPAVTEGGSPTLQHHIGLPMQTQTYEDSCITGGIIVLHCNVKVRMAYKMKVQRSLMYS